MNRPQPRYKGSPLTAEAVLNALDQPLSDEEMIAQLTRLMTIVKTAEIGKAIIAQLVIDSEVSENNKPVLSAISASFEKTMADKKLSFSDKIAYSMAALLAAYELGKKH